jgi:hypothetical protein
MRFVRLKKEPGTPRPGSKITFTYQKIQKERFMDTIRQIQEKLFEMQQKNSAIQKYQDDVISLQSDIDTLLIDLKYDYQFEQFMSKGA